MPKKSGKVGFELTESQSVPKFEDGHINGEKIQFRVPRKSSRPPEKDPRRPKRPFLDVEEALRSVGIFGRYQIFTCVVIQYASILWAGIFSLTTLDRIQPTSWTCNDPHSKWSFNNTVYPPPLNKNSVTCQMIANCSHPAGTSSHFKSVVQEWNLVCDKGHIPTLLVELYLAGRILGSILGGHLGDHFGRKTGFFYAQFFIILTSVMSIASRSWKAFAVFQGLNGVFYGIIGVTSLTLMMEYTDAKYRLIPNAMFQWILGYMVVGLVAFLTGDWREFLVIINLIAAPLLVGFLLFQESPRWLISRKRLDEAAEVLSELASDRWNGKNVIVEPEDLVNIPVPRKHRSYNIFYLFSSPRLAIQSFLQMLAVFTYALINSTYLFDAKAVPGGPFLHLVYYGLIRIWVPFLIIYLDWKFQRFGRKVLYLTSLGLTGSFFLANIGLLASGLPPHHWSIVSFTILGTIINASAFYMAIVQITAAAYPTVMRGTAFGTLHLFESIGDLVSILFIEPLADAWAAWPYIIVEIMIIVTGGLAVFLQPETKDRPLPDRYRQVRQGIGKIWLFSK